MWCVGKHPLILGMPLGDPTKSPTCTDCTSAEDVLEILRNKDLIEVNQDALGTPAKPLTTTSGGRSNYVNVCRSGGSASVLLWSGPLSGGDLVVMLLNKEGNTAAKAMDCAAASVDLTALGVARGAKLACWNLWTNASCGMLTAGSQNLTQSVPSHSAGVLRLSPVHRSSNRGEQPIAKEASRHPAAQPAAMPHDGFVATTQLFPAVATRASTHGARAVNKAGNAVPYLMRGGDAAHSGRTAATGPALEGDYGEEGTAPPIKWSWGNVTQGGTSPTAFESIPAVTSSGLVLAAASYGSYGGSKVAILHALDVETGTSTQALCRPTRTPFLSTTLSMKNRAKRASSGV